MITPERVEFKELDISMQFFNNNMFWFKTSKSKAKVIHSFDPLVISTTKEFNPETLVNILFGKMKIDFKEE